MQAYEENFLKKQCFAIGRPIKKSPKALGYRAY
jgi:hypothetical protein